MAAKTRWIGLVVFLLLLGGGLAMTLLRAPAVEAMVVQSGPMLRTLQFSARVATLSRVEVGSTITGRVARVTRREGALVQRGDLLVVLESDELQAGLTQAQATERQASATLLAARAALTRAEQLVQQNFYSPAQLDENRRAAEVAQAQLGQARASVQAAQVRLEQTRIVAPQQARVLARLVEPGQIVQPGKALMSLALSGPTQLVAQVDERFLEQLRVGQPAMVVADAYAQQRFGARVLSIAPQVDAQRGAIEVKFELVKPIPDFLREDMTLSVEVETGRRERALVLPLAALRGLDPDGQGTVLVVKDERVQQRRVRLGLRSLEAAEVLEGLAQGDQVLLGHTLQVGQRVKVKTVPWAPGNASLPGGRPEDAGSAVVNAMGR